MRYLILILLITISASVQAQDVVNWKYAAKKIADKTYEVKLTAIVQEPWHIYSSTTPDGGPLPTSISFAKNPLVTLTGKVKEKGKLTEKYEEVFDINVKYFDGNADFVQVVKLKSNAKTNLSGAIEFMACNDTQCLPPQTVNFTVKLE